jgi:hypothetical protein
VFAGFLAVFLVEFADEVLEQRAHRVIVYRGLFHRTVAAQDGVGTEIDFMIKKLADERAEGIRLREARHRVAKLEIAKDVLNVRRKPVEINGL